MNRLDAWLMHGANALVGGTGLIYAVLRYLLEPADPFAVVNHPLEPTLQHLHVLTAPVFVFVAGLLWHRHVLGRLKGGHRERRNSGWSLILALAPMIASGYLIQTANDDTWRSIWVGVHLVSSAAWLAGYLAHLVARRSQARERAAQPLAAATSTRG